MTKNTLLPITLAAFTVASALPTFAEEKVELLYSDTVSEQDARTQVLKSAFGECLTDDFDLQTHHGATLFSQGTEMVAMQRGNLDMASLAIFDFYNQVPETSILGAAYMFRDYDHMRRVFDGDVLNELYQKIEDRTGIKILANPYIGTRHISLNNDDVVMTPSDLEGVKLRMPPGEGWQFVGEALGANPTPIPFTEVYTALQTGAIDGQDNPLPANYSMKFYEVSEQTILTGHLIAANQFSISSRKWNSLNAEQQDTLKTCAMNFQNELDKLALDQEAELISYFEEEGLNIYTPDKEAFRSHVLEQYENSEYSDDWPKGLYEAINAL
ncbi:TRAP transporter substrate-binding protein DctP [Saccharospirillum sp.]|uniref:TRAP transporter substrate-binding protein DctP n=1 Tax=Saccharospirillum sp. TaxID=2033801 RepID=UPI00349FF1BE